MLQETINFIREEIRCHFCPLIYQAITIVGRNYKALTAFCLHRPVNYYWPLCALLGAYKLIFGRFVLVFQVREISWCLSFQGHCSSFLNIGPVPALSESSSASPCPLWVLKNKSWSPDEYFSQILWHTKLLVPCIWKKYLLFTNVI